jgi:hypothetical protein
VWGNTLIETYPERDLREPTRRCRDESDLKQSLLDLAGETGLEKGGDLPVRGPDLPFWFCRLPDPAANGEEIAEQRRRLALADAAIDLGRVVAGRLRE